MNKKNQSGLVLIGGLFFLTVMTLVGVAMIKNVALEEKIASNTKEKLRSVELADIALKVADEHLKQKPNVTHFYTDAGAGSNPGLYSEDGDVSQPWELSSGWSSQYSVSVTDATHVPEEARMDSSEVAQLNANEAPRYMIGLVGEQTVDGMDSGISQQFFIFTATSRADSSVGHIGTTLQTRIIRSL